MPLWWLCWLGGNILSNISMRASFRSGGELFGAYIDLVAGPMSMIAMALYMSYVWKVRQSAGELVAGNLWRLSPCRSGRGWRRRPRRTRARC